MLRFFCANLSTETRITSSNAVAAISLYSDVPQNPIHLFYADDRIERRINSYFRRAFGKDLIAFHAGGGGWPLLVGSRPKLHPGEDRLSATYIARLRAQTVDLQEQGDGMRSFASVILGLLA